MLFTVMLLELGRELLKCYAMSFGASASIFSLLSSYLTGKSERTRENWILNKFSLFFHFSCLIFSLLFFPFPVVHLFLIAVQLYMGQK